MTWSLDLYRDERPRGDAVIAGADNLIHDVKHQAEGMLDRPEHYKNISNKSQAALPDNVALTGTRKGTFASPTG